MIECDCLASALGVTVYDVKAIESSSSWTPYRVSWANGFALVRTGGFTRQAAGQAAFVDAGGGFFAQLDSDERFAHPTEAECRYTCLAMTPEAYDTHVDGSDRWQGWLLTTPASFDLQHRKLLAAIRRGEDAFELSERLCVLLEGLPPRTDRPGPGVRDGTLSSHRRLVSEAREALHRGHLTLSLDELAASIGTSPHHLSRVFRRMTGRTLTDYRNELRIRSVLEQLADGAANLADLAAAHGFVDHTHLTRTVRRHLGTPPSALRSELSTKVLDP